MAEESRPHQNALYHSSIDPAFAMIALLLTSEANLAITVPLALGWIKPSMIAIWPPAGAVLFGLLALQVAGML